MIDLTDDRVAVGALIEESLASFASEHPRTAWSTFALYACPWSGWIMSCFDTDANSRARVAGLVSDGLNWFGEDDRGRYNNSCPDFAFVEWRSLDLPHWQAAYEAETPLRIRDLSGTLHRLGEDDEAFNGVTFDFLASMLRGAGIPAPTGNRAHLRTCRLGVMLLDSAHKTFWSLPNPQN
tara:strand:- start:455 stop:994 length:540 start_codon:yes stop_codon:yes gene_type:complete